jgi:hypothetical protein
VDLPTFTAENFPTQQNFLPKPALKITSIDKLLSEEGYNFAHREIIDRHEMEP